MAFSMGKSYVYLLVVSTPLKNMKVSWDVYLFSILPERAFLLALPAVFISRPGLSEPQELR